MSGQVCGFENEYFNWISFYIWDDCRIIEVCVLVIVDQLFVYKVGLLKVVQVIELVVIDLVWCE